MWDDVISAALTDGGLTTALTGVPSFSEAGVVEGSLFPVNPIQNHARTACEGTGMPSTAIRSVQSVQAKFRTQFTGTLSSCVELRHQPILD